MKFNNKISKEI